MGGRLDDARVSSLRRRRPQVAIEDLSQKLKLKMETRKIEYNQGLPDKIFTEQHLKTFITDASTKRESGK